MTFIEPKNLWTQLRELIDKEISKLRAITIWKVTDIQPATYSCNIRDLNWKQIEYKNVPMMGFGLGNFKGLIKLPEVDDLVVVMFLGGSDPVPIIIGSVFDVFTANPDNIPIIAQNEVLLANKSLGSIIFISSSNEITLKVSDATGNIDGGARIKLSPDGSFKVFTKDNYGIEVDASGNMELRGVTINHTQNPGTF